MTTSTIPPSRRSYLHMKSTDYGNRVHGFVGAEVVCGLPAIPAGAVYANAGYYMNDILRIAQQVGFDVPMDAPLACVYFDGDDGVTHTYVWVADDAPGVV